MNISLLSLRWCTLRTRVCDALVCVVCLAGRKSLWKKEVNCKFYFYNAKQKLRLQIPPWIIWTFSIFESFLIKDENNCLFIEERGLSGLRCCKRVGRFLVETLPSVQLGLGILKLIKTQWLPSGEWSCLLNNGPK